MINSQNFSFSGNSVKYDRQGRSPCATVDLVLSALFSAGNRTGALWRQQKATTIGGRTGVADHRSHGCFRVRTWGIGSLVSLLTDDLARLRPSKEQHRDQDVEIPGARAGCKHGS